MSKSPEYTRKELSYIGLSDKEIEELYSESMTFMLEEDPKTFRIANERGEYLKIGLETEKINELLHERGIRGC